MPNECLLLLSDEAMLRPQAVAFTIMDVHPALPCHISRSPQRSVLVPESHTGLAKISSESVFYFRFRQSTL
jgi:hypothetical protein